MKSNNLSGTILIIDDDENVLELTTFYLSSYGFDVIYATTTKKAEEIIEKHKPDLVLLDYKLPDKDGVSFLKEIRHKHLDTYFIFITGGGSAEVAVEAMKAGAIDYLSKPFKREVLVDRVKSALKIRTVEIMNRRLQEEIERWNRELEKRVKEKAQELNTAYQQILQSEKMAILGHLSTGMAHDIRNPLNTINLFLQILRDDLSDDEEKLEYINIISDNSNRINLILEKLLETSKRPKYQLKYQDINEIIKNTISLYEHQAFLQHVEIAHDLDLNIPDLEVDYNEIEQLFSNLIINAFYVLKSGGKIDIVTKLKDSHILISVTDNGTGIKKKDIANIFDPFFTTKETVKGSGLGLSVVNRVVTSYGGKIDVESKLTEYTRFNIKLPLNYNK
jgi:signal transduction histidine kinase